jgi:hypothetical protein
MAASLEVIRSCEECAFLLEFLNYWGFCRGNWFYGTVCGMSTEKTKCDTQLSTGTQATDAIINSFAYHFTCVKIDFKIFISVHLFYYLQLKAIKAVP